MAGIEQVTAAGLDHFPDVFRVFFGAPFGGSSRHEFLFHGADDVDFLLGDEFQQPHALGQREAADFAGHLGELFLKDQYAVCIFQGIVSAPQVNGRHLLTAAEQVFLCRARIERRRAVQGTGGNQIADTLRPHVLQEAGHARRRELEDVLRVALRQDTVSLLVVQSAAHDALEGEPRTVFPVADVDDGLYLRQLLDTQTVVFQQPDLVDGVSVQLGDEQVVHFLDGRVVEAFHRLAVLLFGRDDDGRGMHGTGTRLTHKRADVLDDLRIP